MVFDAEQGDSSSLVSITTSGPVLLGAAIH